jgi:hypothetical protein
MEKKKIIEEAMDKIISSKQEHFDKEQQKPFQYVVGYYKVEDDSLIGYHADSFCSLTDNKLGGKRYNGEDPYTQLTVVRKNLDYILDRQNFEEKGNIGYIFTTITKSIKEKYYQDYKKEDIYINAEYLDENIPPQKFVSKKIN